MADEAVLFNKEATPAESSRLLGDPVRADGDSDSDEGCDEARALADKEFARKDEATASDGLREGLADGKDKALQQGFDSGFKQVRFDMNLLLIR